LPEHVAFAGTPQRHLDVAHPVHAVGRHPGKRNIRSDGPLVHRKSKPGLRGERGLGGHVSCHEAGGVIRPALRQIESAIDEGVTMP